MKLAFATVGLALTLGLGCSSGSGGPGSVGSGATSTLSGFAQQYCSLLQPCCAQAGLSENAPVCVGLVEAFSQGSTYDAANGQACIAAAQQQASSPTFCSMVGSGIPACSQVFSASGGTVPGGQPCTQDSDCAPAPGGGATCFGEFSFEDGGSAETQTCIQTTAGTAGDGPCVGTVEGDVTLYSWSGSTAPPPQGFLCNNADGLTCDGTTLKCVALAAVGASCLSDSDCVPSAYCAFNASGEQCAARLVDGTSCAAAPTGCLATSYCDPGTMTCQPELALGSACTADAQCASGACVNQACAAGDDLGVALFCASN